MGRLYTRFTRLSRKQPRFGLRRLYQWREGDRRTSYDGIRRMALDEKQIELTSPCHQYNRIVVAITTK